MEEKISCVAARPLRMEQSNTVFDLMYYSYYSYSCLRTAALIPIFALGIVSLKKGWIVTHLLDCLVPPSPPSLPSKPA